MIAGAAASRPMRDDKVAARRIVWQPNNPAVQLSLSVLGTLATLAALPLFFLLRAHHEFLLMAGRAFAAALLDEGIEIVAAVIVSDFVARIDRLDRGDQ